jgi:hypothetical protein
LKRPRINSPLQASPKPFLVQFEHEVERELVRTARAQKVKPETLIREAVRAYVGRAA